MKKKLNIGDVLCDNNKLISKHIIVKTTKVTATADTGMLFECEYNYPHCIKTKKQWRNKVRYPSHFFKLIQCENL